MDLVIVFAISALAILVVGLLVGGGPHAGGPEIPRGQRLLEAATVQRVLDGGTVIVQCDHRDLTLHLNGIDCPSRRQYWGDAAAEALVELVGGKSVRYANDGIDKQDRILATIYIREAGQRNWLNVNVRMVALGHAWTSSQGFTELPAKQRRDLIHAERRARREGLGLWKCATPIPPLHWRRLRTAVSNSVSRFRRRRQ